MSKRTVRTLALGALAALTMALAPSSDSNADTSSPPAPQDTSTARADAPFIELSSGGRREARFDGACGTVNAEVIDPDSTEPRLILSGSCRGTAFDVVAHPTALPGTPRVSRVRFLDIATGQERIASGASLDVQQFGAVGGGVAGSLSFSLPATLNRPAQQVTGTFRVIRSANRFSP